MSLPLSFFRVLFRHWPVRPLFVARQRQIILSAPLRVPINGEGSIPSVSVGRARVSHCPRQSIVNYVHFNFLHDIFLSRTKNSTASNVFHAVSYLQATEYSYCIAFSTRTVIELCRKLVSFLKHFLLNQPRLSRIIRKSFCKDYIYYWTENILYRQFVQVYGRRE